MTDRLSPTAMHDSLDHAGLLNTSRGPGVYAIELAVPDDAEATHRRWRACHDAVPGDNALGRISRADRVAYVGASKEVYARLVDHCEGEKRQTAYCEAFPPVAVVDIWPDGDPFEAEFARAWDLAREGWAVVCNGQVLSG